MKTKVFEMLKKKGIIYTNQQQDAVLHNEGPALVLAVPGSGKTTTIMGRVAHLITDKRVNPDNILAITFSRASASDMTARFDELFKGDINRGVRFSTIHSFANTVVSSYNKKFNVNLTLLQPWQTGQIVKGIYKSLTRLELTDEELEGYVTGISYVKNKMLSKKDIKAYEKESDLDELGDVIERYEHDKSARGYYDYDDMLGTCLKILKENEVTLQYLRNKYKYIMLDEAQDTTKLQFEIIKLIAMPSNNIFIVADDDQTVYGFRGASPEMLLDVESIFKNTKVYFMEQNFRSTQGIIEVANNIIIDNKNRYSKEMTTNKNGEFSAVEIVHMLEGRQNAYIVENIKKSNNDVALLYRNNLSVISLANALAKNGIEFHTNNYKSSFFKHWILKDIINIINLINDKSDINAIAGIYYKIKTYLDKDKARQLMSIKKDDLNGEDAFDYILNNFRLKNHEHDRILDLKLLFKRVRKKKDASGLKTFLRGIDYLEFLEKSEAKSAGYLEIVDTIADILKGVKYEEAYAEISQLNSVVEKSMGNSGCRVSLSTLHGSKGLEFTEVYLLSVLSSILPSTTDLDNEKVLEEERRLFYVGATRAKEKLRILVPGYNPSVFIRNIKDKKLDSKYLEVQKFA